MSTLFDYADSEARKRRGMEAAERGELLEFARDVARGIALRRPDRCCTADDVQEALAGYGLDPSDLGPAAGALFKGREWVFTGRRVRSKQVRNHARELKVWRLVDK